MDREMHAILESGDEISEPIALIGASDKMGINLNLIFRMNNMDWCMWNPF